MPNSPSVPIERALAKLAPSLRSSEAEAVLEVVYLAMVSDGKQRDEELAAFQLLTGHVLSLVGAERDAYRGAPRPDPENVGGRAVLERLDRFAAALDREGASKRLAWLATRLTRAVARDFAYQMAYSMVLADLDTNEQELRFDATLRRALGLVDDWAEVLADDVISGLAS